MNNRTTAKWLKTVLLKGKEILNKKQYTENDKFIINFAQNRSSDVNNMEVMDIRRVVFVSLTDLYRTWKKYESHILYSAIIIVPLQKKWICDPSKYHNQLCSTININVSFKQKSEQYLQFVEFIEFLKWKDSQQLMFYMLDEYKYPENVENKIVSPFWHYLSNKLMNLYDPVTQKKYKPLQIDIRWWQRTDFECKFDTKVLDVLEELYCVTMKFKTIQEIIYQSNPTSLKPIKYFGESIENNNFVKHIITVNKQEQEWYISTDYF